MTDTRFQVIGKLFIDSTARRTTVVMAVFDTLADAGAFIASSFEAGTLTGGEELTVEVIDR